MRRLAATLAASTLVVGGMTALGAAPAFAYTEKCTDYQHKEFPTPGYDVDVWIKLCVSSTLSGYHFANAYGYYSDGGGAINNFDNFDLQVRVERSDVSKGSLTCDYTNSLNNNGTGAFSCGSASTTSTADGGWTADATVYYNINQDGSGGYSWGLTGTPSIT